jgi:outer membrane protein OmpA-like peptidoglycan-associated protein/Tol biopolymer transport system component
MKPICPNILIRALSRIAIFLFLLSFPMLTIAQGNAKEHIKDAERAINKLDYPTARQSLESAIKIKEKFPIAHRLLGVVNSRMGNFAAAVTSYERLFQLQPDFSRAAYFEAGQAYMKIYDYEKALRCFQRYKTGDNRDFSSDEQTIQIGYDILLEREMNSCVFGRGVDFGAKIEEATNMGNVINSKYDEYLPTLTSDGQLLIYTSDKEGENILVSRRKEDKSWTESKSIGKGINTGRNEGMAKLTVCGRTLYFSACGWENGLGGCDVFKASFDYDEATGYDVAPVRELNSKVWDSQPSISCDGKTMYFASSREGGLGGTDIWTSTIDKNGNWSPPVNMGASINTAADEEAPYIAPDGVTLYFSSDGHPGFGEMDIFRAVRSGDVWSQPLNLGRTFNTPYREAGIVISPEYDMAYFASAREGGKGGLDIYQAKIAANLAPAVDNVLIDGYIFDIHSGEPVSGVVVKIGTALGRQVLVTDAAGRFFICLPNKNTYSYILEKADYENHIGADFFERTPQSSSQRVEVALTPVLKKQETKVEPTATPTATPRVRKNLSVYFESGKHELTDVQKEQIKQLFSQQPDKSKIKVKVTGFADDIGNKEFNQSLSEKRASFVARYIEQLDVPKDQIIYDGQGVVDSNIAKHQKRRVEIVISN